MNDKDKKYLRSTQKMGPSFGTFSKMVKILTSVQNKTTQIQAEMDEILVEPSKDI